MDSTQIRTETSVIVEPTWAICTKIWWSLTWRCLLWGMPVSMLCAASLSAIVKIAGFYYQGIMLLTLMGTAVLMSIFIIKRILRLPFKNFRVVLVAPLYEEQK